MRFMQNGNLAKLVAFFVIALVISCTVSFAANGWQSFVVDTPSSDKTVSNDNKGNVNEDKTDEENNTNTDIPVVVPEQTYYHPITGLQTDANGAGTRPLCFVFSSQDPLYGISSSYLTIEIPTEYGNTRLLCFTDDAKTLGKIGSLAPSRGYISNFAAYFGGVLLSYGNDDTVDYDSLALGSHLDFLATTGYCYSEYNSFIYTNADLVNAIINNSNVNTNYTDVITLPYDFNNGDESINDETRIANTISISYSDGNSTHLVYSSTDECFYLSKNSGVKTDLLNDKMLKYENAFVLFADSTTYESDNATELIIDTYTKGTGLYFGNGSYVEISWERDADDNLVFYDDSGNKLSVNRGASYIGFVKSSMKSSVKIG